MKRSKLVGDAISVRHDGVQVGHYQNFSLHSAYQPIWVYDKAKGFSPYGYEGLIRPFVDGKLWSPMDMFARVTHGDELFVECLCHALHLRNYHHCLPDEGSLFFNINPNNYPTISAFERNFRIILDKLPTLNIARENIVLEIVETDQKADGVLQRMRDYAHDEGIRLAIDDFGQDCSTLERYLAFMPEIVKVDREVFKNACDCFVACRFLYQLIQKFHDKGTTVLIEGIETHKQFEVAHTLGANLYQGFYLGRPTILPTSFNKPTVDNKRQLLSA